MRILKVANITDSWNTGMGRVMHSTADELRQLGHSVDLCFSSDVARPLSGRGDRFLFPIALVKTVRDLLRQRGQYDIVEIHEPSAAWYCYQRKRDKSLPPCVIMSHGLEETQWQLRKELDRSLGKKTSWKSRILVPLTLLSQARYGIKQAQQIMCLNTFDQEHLLMSLKIAPEKISIVQNGVSSLFFDQEQTRYIHQKSLLFVGSWLERKGIQTLSEAYTKLHMEDPETTLTLAGTGISESEVLLSFPVGIRSSVRVIASVTDLQLKDLYYQHAIFTFPSYFEPWGLVLMEAAAAGMAIVTTNVGGPKNLFSDGVNAVLIPVTNSEALVLSLRSLLQNSDVRKRLGRAAQEHAQQFTWTAAAQSHLCAYERAISVARTEGH